MNKLTLTLTPQDVKILTAVLEYALTSTDMKTLQRDNLEAFLALSCLHEFFNKLDKKNNEIQAFGYTPGKPVKVIMRRFEALAFFLICSTTTPSDGSFLPAVPNQTANLLREINGDIHKHYLV